MDGARGDRSSARLGNLPVELSSFVNRDAVLAQARSLLGASRLVTMVGTGGAGKTRLAIRVASDMQESFAGGAWFVDLSALHDSGLLADTVGDALRLVPEPGRSIVESLGNHFDGRPALLVLDNCEHLIAACAALATELLGRCAELTILATSREPLGLLGESTLPIVSMPVPEPLGAAVDSPAQYESVGLFVDRARQAYPEFSVTEATLRTVGEICYRLDGLPLAIELAAVRLRALSVDQLCARLSHPYRLLTGGSRTAPERQRTLRSSIAWSYDLCSEAEQVTWARLSTFAGGFELDAAEAVCSGDHVEREQVLDVLQSLVEKSVLIRTEQAETVWYRMLETIREFGGQQLSESGLVDTLRQRHADWYRQLLQDAEADWVSPRQHHWLARMYRELANIRAALEYTLEPAPAQASMNEPALALVVSAWRICWWALARVDELQIWLDRALAKSAGPSLLRGRALLVKAYLRASDGDHEFGVLDLAEGRAIAEQFGDRVGIALAATVEALASEDRGDLEQSVAWYERALEALSDYAEGGGYLNVLARLAATCDRAGDLERSALYRDRAFEISEQSGEVFERSYLLLLLGISTWQRGELGKAERLVTQALRFKRELGDPVGAAMAVQTLACIAATADRPDQAAVLLGAADILWDSSGAGPASFPLFLRFHEECERTVEAALGRDAFDRAFAHARRLDFSGVIALALGEQSRPAPAGRSLNPLTSREQQVAELVAEGLTNKQIAVRLILALRTVEGHTERIRTKLGCSSRIQIALWVHENRQFTQR